MPSQTDLPDEQILPLAPFNSTSPPREALQARLLELGEFACLHGNVILIFPPVSTTEAELARGLAALDLALAMPDAACCNAATGKGG
jgi:hypothetical protein